MKKTATTILILGIALAITPALYAQQVRQFTAVIEPTEVCAGETEEFTITITNSASSTQELGSAKVQVPSGFTNVSIILVEYPQTGGPTSGIQDGKKHWDAIISEGMIKLAPTGGSEGNKKLSGGEFVSVTFSATAPTTVDDYEWTVSGYQGTAWDDENFAIHGAQPVVTVILCDLDGTYETAWAYDGEGIATCFLDIDDLNANRWGWTNGPLAPLGENDDPYEFEIWAAAGQCDTSKGVLVGALIVEYDGSTATVTYEMASGYTLAQVHLYVGSEMLPLDKKGDATVAPGQFPYKDAEIEESLQTNYPISITGLSGDIYVIAHAVVYGDFSEAEE